MEVDPAAATPFGRYQLLSLLGRGGMGEVWRAHDSVTGRVVALKVLLPECCDDDEFLRRFRREALAAASFDEPHVVPIHNFGEINGRLFVEMRLIEGRDLNAVLQEGPLSPERAVAIIEQIASALQAAHRVGLVHRDVKPSNILIADDDFAYLIDFGFASAARAAKLTITGITVGTWAYLAPERFNTGANDTRTDPRSDIYALTCVLYESLTGARPFPGYSIERQYVGHVSTAPPRPSTQHPAIPPALDDVIARGMAKSPDDRYQSVSELARAARAAIDTRTSRAPGIQSRDPWGAHIQLAPTQLAPTRQPHRTKALLIAAALTAIALTAATTFALINHHGPTPTTTQSPAGTTPSPKTYGQQSVLPFVGLRNPHGIAVDTSGDVVVADTDNARVVELRTGSSVQSDLPFTGLADPMGVAVDEKSAVYVTDFANPGRVAKLAPGEVKPIILDFTDVRFPSCVGVDGSGNVYTTHSDGVLKLAADSRHQIPVPFTQFRPGAFAVDKAGNIYAIDYSTKQVVTLTSDWKNQSLLPFANGDPTGIAVDSEGDVYLTDIARGQVLVLLNGSSSATVLPFHDLQKPVDIAVDSEGNVYVSDFAANNVVMLPAT